VHFLEPVQIQNDQAERLPVAPGAIQFFLEGFAKKPPIVKTGERIGDGVQFELFQVVILDDDGDAKKPGSRQNIHESGFERYRMPSLAGQVATPREHVVPHLNALRFAQINVRGSSKKTLEKLPACRRIEAFERLCEQLEIGILY